MSLEQMNPPGQTLEAIAPAAKAPVLTDRSFLVEPIVWEGELPEGVIIPVNRFGNQMSPIEARTGVPLPIVAPFNQRRPNRHHAHFFKPDYVNGPLWLQAVRYSRLQWVGVAPHNVYHRTFDGTAFPQGINAAYDTTILNCAGYIPAWGVKITGRNMEIAELMTLERKKLRRPGTFCVEQQAAERSVIGQFLMNHALNQDLNSIDLNHDHIQEFVAITDEDMLKNEVLRQRKLRLGMKLANKAIGGAVCQVNDDYQRARKTYMLRKHTPSTPWEIAKFQIAGREPDYFDTLKTRLVEDFKIPA